MDELQKEYEEKYVKKYPLEKGVYTQCIPNPSRPSEFITVQVVRRRLEYKYNVGSIEDPRPKIR